MAKTVTALIVDDDRAMQRLLADALTHEGFSVCVEKDGEWALKTFQKRSIQVVLLDILLPAVNGYEVARKLRLSAKGAHTPIIFLSGVYRAPVQRQEAVEKYGAVDFLEKPFKLPQLREALKQALGDDYPDAAFALAERERIEKSDPGHFASAAAALEAQQVEQESRAPAGGVAPALRGNLGHKPFAELLAEIYRSRADGALLLRRDKVKKIVYFRGGQPYFVKSNLLSECLGKILVKEKLISEAECEESLARMKSSQRQQGTVLIEMGCISPPNLGYALALQLQAKLFDVFSWPEGEFQFNAKAELPPEAATLELTTAAIIYEGLKRTQDLDAINALMQPHQGLFVHPAPDPLYRFQNAGLDEEELALLAACDGRKTVKTLAALAVLPPIETLRLLLAMKYAQMVELKDEPAAAPERALPDTTATVPVPWSTGDTGVGPVAGAPEAATQLEIPRVTATHAVEDDRDETVVDRKAYVPAPPVARPPQPTVVPHAEELPARSRPAHDALAAPGPRLKPPRGKKRRTAEVEAAPVGRARGTSRKSAAPPPPPVTVPPPLPKREPESARPPPMPPRNAFRPVQARAASSLLPELSAVLSLHMSAEERALREQLAAKVVALKRKDYFQMLGVAPDAKPESLKQAYFALAKEFHPDRHYRSASLEVKSLANEIYQLISTAYETLKDPEERERYVADLAKGIKKDVSDEVSKILAAEGKFQRGEELLRKKLYRDAHAAFAEAVKLYDQEGEFHAFLGWSLFQTEPRNPKVAQAAMDHLESAIRLNPKVDKSYLFLGYVFKATGRPDKAQQQFERAIQCNPDCTEALRELRLLGHK